MDTSIHIGKWQAASSSKGEQRGRRQLKLVINRRGLLPGVTVAVFAVSPLLARPRLLNHGLSSAQLPRGFALCVAFAVHGSSGHGWRG